MSSILLQYLYVSILIFFSVHALSLNDKHRIVLEPNNIQFKDIDDLKIDLDINEDDYQIISKQTKNLKIKHENKIFKEFNKFASNAYEGAMKSNRAETAQVKEITRDDKEYVPLETTQTGRMSQTRKINTNNEEKEEHHYLVSEYTKETSEPVVLNKTEYGKAVVGMVTLKHMVVEFFTKHYNNETLPKHIWKIAFIWLAVYCVIAMPLWCTSGWCSCCLCCKFFKPTQTIQAAKNYLLLNPPGILVTKKGGIIQYEPTEREKDCYEEFGHFLRTL